MKVKTVTPLQESYPKSLLQITDPPEMLYYIGNLSLADQLCVAVVGSRKPTDYGRMVALEISARLGESGVAVVSGMATGIDTFSHQGALMAGGKTIAVLGCGADVCYPARNRALKCQIEEQGLILSEQPPGFPPLPHTFPLRNRIISGLAKSVVVVEAGIKSGSLITAERAAEQGKNIYAVPGNITSPASQGTNRLIADGAIPLLSAGELLDGLGLLKVNTNLVISKLSEDEKTVYKAILKQGETTVDSLCHRIGMGISKVSGIITVLELKGVVYTSYGKIFIVK